MKKRSHLGSKGWSPHRTHITIYVSRVPRYKYSVQCIACVSAAGGVHLWIMNAPRIGSSCKQASVCARSLTSGESCECRGSGGHIHSLQLPNVKLFCRDLPRHCAQTYKLGESSKVSGQLYTSLLCHQDTAFT